MTKLAANLSMLFTEHEFLARFEAAANAGFKAVEYLFPYDYTAAEIKSRLDASGLTQVLFNLPAGDWASGDRGIACDPDRMQEFRDGVFLAINYARVLAVPRLNCLAGIIPKGVSDKLAQDTLVANLRFAADELEKVDIELVTEAINTRDIPGFFLRGTEQAVDILNRVGSRNLKLQYDIYHMQIMEGDICNTLRSHLRRIAHIQLADNPGRHEPGSGELNYRFIFEFLNSLGYEGWMGCEYKPATTTEAGLKWLKSHGVAS